MESELRNFRAWLLKTATALPGSVWPGSGLVLDPAWPTAPPPPLGSPSCLFATSSSAISSSFSLARMPNANVWLMRRTHTCSRARAACPRRRSPASPRGPPALPPVSLLRHYPPPPPPPPPPLPLASFSAAAAAATAASNTMRHVALPRRHGNDILPHACAPSDIAASTSSGSGNGSGGGDSIRGSSCSWLPPGSYRE